ncbi:MAG TPA: TlpA disulfide reductase family protein [Pirellulales bacterium]|nr:TlpA disulfide reductase family protein [Pirellulales bacterium]
MRSRECLLIVAMGSVLVASMCGGARAVEGIRAYNLVVGRELRYERRFGSWIDRADGKPEIPREDDGLPKGERHDLRLFVTAKNDDGSFHVVIDTHSAADYPLVTQAELFPDGRIVHDPPSMPILPEDTLQLLFPRLPANEHELKNGWQQVESRTGVRWSYEAEGNDIRGGLAGPLDRVGLGTVKITYRLNPTTALPESIEVNGRWQRYKETSYELVRFKEAVEHDEKWAAGFHASARRYFDCMRDQRRLQRQNLVPLARASQTEGEAEAVFDKARAALVAARDETEEPLFRSHLDRALADFDNRRKLYLESAQRFGRIAGLPSPAWTAADLDGREHRLDQYKGRVLVLDFWFRQCNYCIRAMPQVEQAADHFRGAKAAVAFCSVNTDEDRADPRFVAQELALKDPVLCSKDIAERYGIRSFPTFLILDAEGTVQGILSGYSSTLREDLIACVEELLGRRPAKGN